MLSLLNGTFYYYCFFWHKDWDYDCRVEGNLQAFTTTILVHPHDLAAFSQTHSVGTILLVMEESAAFIDIKG